MSVLDSSGLGAYREVVAEALDEMARQDVVRRIWDHDHTVWKPDPTEISNRLDWLIIMDQVRVNIDNFYKVMHEVRGMGFNEVVLLGMGGSSLAPELFAKVFGPKVRGLKLSVLDSTDPGAVLAFDQRLNLRKTLFVVASKSGTTVEIHSFFKHFYNRALEKCGPDKAGEHFIAITDKGSKLAQLAERLGFYATFLNNPNIGGRYSALSFFGLLPATLVGVDIEKLLERASQMAARCKPETPIDQNPGAVLGAAMGMAARHGRDKLTLVTDPQIAPFGDWVEQLIAESTGKEGTGILPVVGEAAGDASFYGDDRAFVHIRMAGDSGHRISNDITEQALRAAGHPVMRFSLRDPYDIGGQLFLWEFATAVAGWVLGINPFDQPNVESAKKRATAMVNAYQQSGQLPDWESTPAMPMALAGFLEQGAAGDYVAIQAFLQPSEAMNAALENLRAAIRARTGLATTVGYGPRYLHSTGQLHKGDAGRGLFVMLTHDPAQDAPIPDEPGESASSMSFGVLALAQALGDKQALEENGRRALHFHLSGDEPDSLNYLAQGLV